LVPGQPEYRILIVEDEEENRILLTSLLRDAGLAVRVADDGAQAIALFQAWRLHFTWMDRRMPVIDGIEAARRIRAIEGGREVKIVTVTVLVSKGDRGQVLAVGFDEFIHKPYHAADAYSCMVGQLGIRYDADSVASPEAAAAGHPALPSALAALPGDVREELRNSAAELDVQRIAAVIHRCPTVMRLGGGTVGRRRPVRVYSDPGCIRNNDREAVKELT
jgi:CheY-like chemotaxis protein